jgi:hypothetical protein
VPVSVIRRGSSEALGRHERIGVEHKVVTTSLRDLAAQANFGTSVPRGCQYETK